MPVESIPVELMSTTTEDGVVLHGVLHRPESGQSLNVESHVDVWLLWHGVGGNFYSGRLFKPLIKSLTESGIAVAAVNNRGHDGAFTALANGAPKRMGAAFEVVSECRADARAWLEALRGMGFRRVGLLGHSLGAVKSIYAQAHEVFEMVTRVVSVSAPNLSYNRFTHSAFAETFRADLAHAEQMLKSGHGLDLFEAKVPFPLWIAAEAYMDKYGPDENYELTHLVRQLRVPSLMLYGSLELGAPSGAFDKLPEQLSNLENAEDWLTVEVIPGADHFYTDKSAQLSHAILAWLQGGTDG